MKINTILITLLVAQLLALTLRGTGGDAVGARRTIASVTDSSIELDPKLGGQGLKAWLKEHSVDPDKPASTLGVSTDDLQRALKGKELDTELSGTLEASVAALKVSRVTLAEGPREEESAEDSKDIKRPTFIAFQRTGDDWEIESAQRYPAGREKVRTLLKNIMGASLGTVIATRAAHHTKLRVSELKHDRKVTFTLNGATQTWYVGASKGGAVHLRDASAERVYRVKGLTIWGDMSLDLKRYVDGPFFKLKDATSAVVTGPDARTVSVKKENESWFVEGLTEAEVDHSKAKIFVSSASDVLLKEVAHRLTSAEHTTLKGVDEAKAFGFDSPVKVITKSDQEEASFELAQQGERYYAWKPKSPFIVEVDAYKVQTLKTQKVDDFLTEDAIEARKKAEEAKATPEPTAPVAPVVPEPTVPVAPAAPAPVAPAPVAPTPAAPAPAPAPAPTPATPVAPAPVAPAPAAAPTPVAPATPAPAAPVAQ